VHSGSWQIGKKDFQTERGNRSTHINSIISTDWLPRGLAYAKARESLHLQVRIRIGFILLLLVWFGFGQCCGSGMFIPDPDFLPIPDPGSWIPDPKTSTKERGEKSFVVIPFCSHKFHIIENNFIFEMLKKKNLAQFSKNYRYAKICH
jgi:hypothetical protein